MFRLKQMGETPTSFFGNHIYTYGHDNSIRAVLHKAVDGAAVDSLIFDYMAAADPAIASQIKVVEKSGPFSSPPVVVHPSLDSELKEALRHTLLHMHETSQGKAILDRMNFDRFSPMDDGEYDSIREMYYAVHGENTLNN